MPARRPRATPRPRRGTPDETRARLVAAAAAVFNRDGFTGTDSNRLARAAGYAPGTFYKHFADKRAIFLAAYEEWVSAEWRAIGELVRGGGSPAIVADQVVDLVLALHRRWRGFRASLRALVASDVEARRFYRTLRRRQLDVLAAMRPAGARPRSREQDALLLFALERLCDAAADGELHDLGLSIEKTTDLLRDLVRRQVSPRRGRRPPDVATGSARG